jgi:general secretion pathway protein A
LLGAYTHGRQVVVLSIVKRAAREIGQGSVPKPRFAPSALAVASALVIALAVAVWQWWPDWTRVVASGKHGTETVSAQADSAAADAVSAAGAISAATGTDASAATKPPEPVSTLEASLGSMEARTDTESAMKVLFERWGLDYSALAGASGCERALNAGLHCIYQTGTWNNLREHNRPAVIELQDSSGHKHHVLVTALTADSVSLAMGGSPQEFDVQEVGRLWFGKYLLLWKPPAPAQEILRLGDRGEAIVWLRDALARYRGEPLVADASDLFDRELQAQLMQFQSRHRLTADGVAGANTLAKLQGFLPGQSPVLIADTVATEVR